MQKERIYRRRKRSFRLLTNRQQGVLDAIAAYKADHDGVAPTIRELMVAVGLNSTSAVAYQLGRLEAKGFISRAPGNPRTIEVL